MQGPGRPHISPVTIYAFRLLLHHGSCLVCHACIPAGHGGSSLRPEGNPRGTILPLTCLCIPSENLHVGIEERDMYSLELWGKKINIRQVFLWAEKLRAFSKDILKEGSLCLKKKKSLLESKVNFFLMANFKPTYLLNKYFWMNQKSISSFVLTTKITANIYETMKYFSIAKYFIFVKYLDALRLIKVILYLSFINPEH